MPRKRWRGRLNRSRELGNRRNEEADCDMCRESKLSATGKSVVANVSNAEVQLRRIAGECGPFAGPVVNRRRLQAFAGAAVADGGATGIAPGRVVVGAGCGVAAGGVAVGEVTSFVRSSTSAILNATSISVVTPL